MREKGGGEREIETDRYILTERERQTDRQTGRQTDRRAHNVSQRLRHERLQGHSKFDTVVGKDIG